MELVHRNVISSLHKFHHLLNLLHIQEIHACRQHILLPTKNYYHNQSVITRVHYAHKCTHIHPHQGQKGKEK